MLDADVQPVSVPAGRTDPPQGAPSDERPGSIEEPRDWPDLIRGVLNDPSQLELVFQPIVALQEASIVGYESLARFPSRPSLTPDRWFSAADQLGYGAELEALVVERCLSVRDSLPPNCFLTVNVSPHLLTRPALADLLLNAGDLSRIVIELTEHQQAGDLRPLVALRNRLAGRGALLALDDAGSGYSGLQQMTQLRPHLIKLDRALVADAERDEVKLALAELLGEFAGRIDAWLLAEGVEKWSELEAFLRLGVPLAQGYLLGRPGPPWATMHPQTVTRLRSSLRRIQFTDHVASLVEEVPVEGLATLAATEVALRLDDLGRPIALLLPFRREHDDLSEHRVAPITLRVPLSAGIIDVARRLVARPEHCRFDPIVCVDERGRALGVVRTERVMLYLAQLKSRDRHAENDLIDPPIAKRPEGLS
jgi:EAL domain-containing protein (putative c-di-GMP-specific phosphodiesterase class I)